MGDKGKFTKVLAITGTVFEWVPILFTILTLIITTIVSRKFRLDYLMPAELFPAAFIGFVLLLWTAWRVRICRKIISWGVGAALFTLIGSQVLAVATGLASGAVEPTGWAWILVNIMIALYSLALIVTGCAGIFIIQKLFMNSK